MKVHKYAKNYKPRLEAYRKILKSLGKSLEIVGARALYQFLERYGFRCYVAYGPYWPALKDIFLKQGLLTGTPYSDRGMAASCCGATDEETIVMAEMFRDGYLSFRNCEGTYCYDENSGSLNLYGQLAEDYYLTADENCTFDLDDDSFELYDPEMMQLSVGTGDRKISPEEDRAANELCKDKKQTQLINLDDLSIVEEINDDSSGYWARDIIGYDDEGFEQMALHTASVLSTMELLQMAGVNLGEVIAPDSSTRSALLHNFLIRPEFATNVPRLFDLKVDVIRDAYGSAIMPWSEAILYAVGWDGYEFDKSYALCVLNMLLLKLKPRASGFMSKIKDDLQKFQFNWDGCLDDVMMRYGSLTNSWINRWVLYRKLLNYNLGRPFEEISRQFAVRGCEGFGSSFYDEAVAYIDFFGVDDVDVLESGDVYPFTATGVKVVFIDNSTLTVGASGHVVAILNDVLEEEDAGGRCFHWTGEANKIGIVSIDEEIYATHRLKPGKHGELRNCYSVSWMLSTGRMVTISKVYPGDPDDEAEQRLHCVIESTHDVLLDAS